MITRRHRTEWAGDEIVGPGIPEPDDGFDYPHHGNPEPGVGRMHDPADDLSRWTTKKIFRIDP